MDKIAVMIPCYNEAKTVKKVVEDFRRVLPEATIYVYDNNSTDDTVDLARKAGVLSRVMRKINSVTYEVGKAKAEQAAGMFGLVAGQRAASCPSRVAKPLAKPLTGGWRSATYARSQQSAPCFSRSICSSDFMLI